MAVTLIPQGKRADDPTQAQNHGVECVGRVSFLFEHPLLDALADADKTNYGACKGGVYLTGFKLESVLVSTDQQIQNAKLIPMLNGDSMTLTNTHKAGILTIACTRSSAGIAGGDIIAVADFIRTQGDSYGGTLTVSWTRNGKPKKIKFLKVCVVQCPPFKYAGNDLPDMDVKLSYATYDDGDYPVIKSA